MATETSILPAVEARVAGLADATGRSATAAALADLAQGHLDKAAAAGASGFLGSLRRRYHEGAARSLLGSALETKGLTPQEAASTLAVDRPPQRRSVAPATSGRVATGVR